VLITHPAKELIAPADLLDREPDQAGGTLPIPDALDLEHCAHLALHMGSSKHQCATLSTEMLGRRAHGNCPNPITNFFRCTAI
jgi:hypothetical protein